MFHLSQKQQFFPYYFPFGNKIRNMFEIFVIFIEECKKHKILLIIN